VAFGLRRKRATKAEIWTKVNATLEVVGLSGVGERSVSKLSGGQQQRVALARAIVLEPQVLLFDEPLSNLDAKLRERMRIELRQLQQRLGITSIYVTHDQQEAMVIADRIALMHDGHVDQIGTPAVMYERPASLFGAEFLGSANIWAAEIIGGDDSPRLRAVGGLELLASECDFHAGDLVSVMCRPEHVALRRDPIDGPNVFKAQVILTAFLGNFSDVYLKMGDLTLRAQLSPPQILPLGTDAWVCLPPDKLVLYKHPAGQT
jgi:ABC-type Fe3+/spermidine/putrescine transport system ATPase subunit